jgi:hypothetical protein
MTAPDGGLVFVNPNVAPESEAIFYVNAAGWTRLTAVRGGDFSYSPDGSLIAFTGANEFAGVWLMGNRGQDVRQINTDGSRPVFCTY